MSSSCVEVPSKDYLSTGELADLCHVSKHTIITAIERSELRSSRTPGGHNRIRRDDAIEFMRRHDCLPGDHGRTVLVIDDEGYVFEILREILRPFGCTIHYAANGYEAGKLAERVRPDVILLDIKLPDIDGRDVCQHIREEEFGKRCAIIAVTALKDPEDVEEIFAAGIDDYIAKPFTIGEMREKVGTYLGAAVAR
jgi:excisionase family DNA binding protein